MLLIKMLIVFPTQNSPVKPDCFSLQVLATLQLVLLTASYFSTQWNLLQEELQPYGEIYSHSELQCQHILIRKLNRV
jgi:hypothetical protein